MTHDVSRSRRFFRRQKRRLIGYPLGFIVLCLGLNVTGLADRLFYHPSRGDHGSPKDDGLAFEAADFQSRDGTRLTGWFLPATGKARGTVVHAHGNAANKSNHYPLIAFLPPAGYNVLEFDYRGYGDSEGAPSRRGCIEDLHAAVDCVKRRPDVDPARVVLFGQSLGAAVAIVVAAERPDVRAVAAEAPFTSHRAIARDVLQRSPITWLFAWPVPLLALDGSYAPIDHVDRIAPRPLLVAHGTEDGVIPFRMSEELFERAREPKRLVPIRGAGHLHIPHPDVAREYRAAVVRFFDEALK